MASSPSKAILIVEDSVVTSVAAAHIIEQALPDCQILRAQSCFEARLLVRMYDFQLFVLDVNLPDGCGLDLIPALLVRNPSAGIIVLTSDPLPEYRCLSAKLGVDHFIAKPFRAQALRDAAQKSMGKPAVFDEAPLFTACLRGVSLMDILQLKCLSRSSARLEVAAAEPDLEIGTIDIEQGEIIHAEVNRTTGQCLACGQTALEQIFSWNRGNIEEVPFTPEGERTIHEGWQMLLLTIAQQADEASQAVMVRESQPLQRTCRQSPPFARTSSFNALVQNRFQLTTSAVGRE